jgi:hypothetical protein
MNSDFLHTTLGKLGTPVFRLGLAASYRPGRQAVYRALDEGVNYLFYFGFDTQMTRVVREVVRPRREQYVLATGAYNYIWAHQGLRRTLERRLKQERPSSLDTLARRRLAALESALERASGARLGVCERCGGRIAVARLRALPGTTLCVRCARGAEA